MHELPFKALESYREVSFDDGTSRFNPKAAHTRARDYSCQNLLPGSCTECFRQIEAAAEQGWVPTSPDQAIPLEIERDLA